MRVSEFLLSTVKETPADAELISHRYMIRAGLIRKLSSGLYSWMPLGLRVLRKVENIVREEMNRAGALELLMPTVQPAELWEESGRWEHYGKELLRIKDRHERDFCYGPTHEEVITDIMRHELRSYKQLPLSCYQIQTKFRDEIRPRFGVMRAREFMMKDAYSFHMSEDCLADTYEKMYKAYCSIFARIGLEYRAVQADTGSIGGNASHEFQVLAQSGEDEIYYSDASDYAANVELATALPEKAEPAAAATAELQLIDTPNIKTIAEVSEFLNIKPEQTIKTLIVKGQQDSLVALVLRGDHELNSLKAEKHALIAEPLTMATDTEITQHCGCAPGYIGPIDLNMPIIVDPAAAGLSDFIAGANQTDKHYQGVNWQRDAKITEIFDIRKVVVGDASPDGKGTLQVCRGIEVGHIFQLGHKYSQAMNCKVLDKNGKAVELLMGCYGIGISRIVAASIEQNHDDNGIIWPEAIAPFDVVIVPIKLHKSERLRAACEKLYQDLQDAGFSVLFDDRNERPGVMFADHDLIGIPHRVVLGDRGIDEGIVEYKSRSKDEVIKVPSEELISYLKK